MQVRNDTAYSYGDDKPGIGGDVLPGQRTEAPTKSVHERREEQYRIRRCKIIFYPEDDTIQIIEPRIANTGMSQGTIVKRHRINKPPPNEHLYYTVHDFNVGTEFIAYGKTFRIVACDQFTSNFLRKLGVRLGEPEPIPDDPYSAHRKAVSNSDNYYSNPHFSLKIF
ncbi:unnamed protein product [Trichobilharzia regenti]|nr:unnamed protein product [Trichobilharzia regenti]